MYRESYQRGLLTIFFSCGSKPLKIWETFTKDGYISKFLDEDIKSSVLEIGGTNVSTTYMVCPKGKTVLGITMPFLVMIVKNLKKYFSFEVTILDDTGTRRRFRVSNFQSTTQILPLCTVMPIALSEGWNQIQFNLADFTRRAYQKQFVEVQKFKINANIRVRRIYFADRILAEDELPAEYKLFIPLKQRPSLSKDKGAEEPAVKKPGEDLKKKDSKTLSTSKLTKGSQQAITSESKELKKPSKIVEDSEGEKADAATDAPAAAGESETVDAATDAPVAAAEGGTDQTQAAEDAPAATAEEGAAAEAPVAEAAAAEVPTEAEAPAATAEAVPDQTEVVEVMAATEETKDEPARQSSAEATTQTEPVIIQPVPEETATAEKEEAVDDIEGGDVVPAE